MNENEIVRMFRKNFGIVSEPNDVEHICLDGVNLAAKVDTLVHSTDVPPGMSLYEAARKSAVSCVSDFASKGVKPRWAVISVTMPDTYQDTDYAHISQGLADAAAEFGFEVCGGDTNRGSELSVSVCLLGICGMVPGRSGAVAGDAVCVTGPFGLSAAGLYVMTHDTNLKLKGCIDAMIRPEVRLEFGLQGARHFTSSMDSSDGLSATLNQMADHSKTMMEITHTPAAQGIYDFAHMANLDADSLIYNGGEEYEIVFTAPQSRLPILTRIAKHTDTPLMVIGRVRSGQGVLVDGKVMPDGGWKSF